MRIIWVRSCALNIDVVLSSGIGRMTTLAASTSLATAGASDRKRHNVVVLDWQVHSVS